MRILSLVVVLWLMVNGDLVLGQENEEFDEFETEQRRAFEAFGRAVEQRFSQYIKAEQEAFERFKEDVELLWGTYDRASKKEWVEYDESLHARSHVDFESGVVTIEVLVEDGSQSTELSLAKAIVKAVTAPGVSADYSVPLPDGTTEQPILLGTRPILDGQITTPTGTPVTKGIAAKFAEEIIATNRPKTKPITGKDGRHRTKATVTFQLVPDHLRRRAEAYLPIVRKHARRFSLDVPLVFAVIHTESFFNPQARSSAPAFGLMQLVPTSGGRAAYEFVYKKDRILPQSYFYVPDQNIELGCAYLSLVDQTYFARVKNKASARYCVIASYNTGAGNVSRAFTGRTNVREAIPLIDRMSPEKLYQHLQKNLPYKETRKYVQLVSERIPLYEEWR
jgi:membrane-bound lytic murein transglycosylase C